MAITTINPTTGKTLTTYNTMTTSEVESILEKNHQAFLQWRKTDYTDRARKMKSASQYLLDNKKSFSAIITEEMGKIPKESEAEIEKCALACKYFSENAETFLAPRSIKTEKTKKSYVTYNPLGTVLAIMPWNYPFWQVFRFAAPALMAGNAAILKHSPNTTGSALAIEKIFKETNFPKDLFRTVIVDDKEIDKFISHPRIAAVTLTGSVHTGTIVAREAGNALKKVVLELGGSDPYIILEDADLNIASEIVVRGRMQNLGQSCISPKRILIVKSIFDEFKDIVMTKMKNYSIDKDSSINFEKGHEIKQLAPMARKDLRDHLHSQVKDSVEKGATLLQGGFLPEGPGFYYPPTILSDIKQGMPAYEEELFGPVISLIEVKDEQQAIEVANNTRFGLGAAVFTQDLARGERIATEEIEAGACFVNDGVKSDPRLPFGGIKSSGFGRELSEEGIKEFVNIKTVVIK